MRAVTTSVLYSGIISYDFALGYSCKFRDYDYVASRSFFFFQMRNDDRAGKRQKPGETRYPRVQLAH